MKRETAADKEYWRRVDLCTKAIFKAAQAVGLNCYVTGEYQGCEISVKTEVYAEGKVVVLMRTGYPPRLPEYVTLTVHGVIWYSVNRRVTINGSGLGHSEKSFRPDKISVQWLQKSILQAAQAIQTVCSASNMEKLRKDVLAKRRQECKELGVLARYQNTYLFIEDIDRRN